MAQALPRLVILGLVLIGGMFGLKKYQEGTESAQLRTQLKEKDVIIAQEQKKNELLRSVVKRMQTDRRMARIIVTDQRSEEGRTETKILFSEYDREGSKLLPASTREFTVEGTSIWVDTYVVQFDDKLVEANDPLKGHSLAVFRRIFGRRGPDAGFDLQSASGAPLGHESDNAQQAALEREVWKEFWKLPEDGKLREKYGVKAAFGGSVFNEQFKPGFVYTLTLDPRGGLKMLVDPMDPLIERALRERGTNPS